MSDTSGTDLQPFEHVVGRLFPSFVRAVLTPTSAAECDSRYPEERAAVAGAAARRRREFICGRTSAHAALAAIGRDEGPIGVGTGRQPLWPEGIVGSISHAGDLSGAVVATAGHAWALGFDIEVLHPPLASDVDRLVRTVGERAGGPSDPDHPLAPYDAKIAFSVKESVYKCLFPHTLRRLVFDDVEARVDLGAGRWSARVEAVAGVVEGGFGVAHGYVFTGVCIAAGDGVTG